MRLTLTLLLLLGTTAPALARDVAPTQPLIGRLTQGVTRSFRREAALYRLSRDVARDPKLARRFGEAYGRKGGLSVLSMRQALLFFGVGMAINIGGYFQPELLVPYLLAGLAADVTAFAVRVYDVMRSRHNTLLSMIENRQLPAKVVRPHAEALGLQK